MSGPSLQAVETAPALRGDRLAITMAKPLPEPNETLRMVTILAGTDDLEEAALRIIRTVLALDEVHTGVCGERPPDHALLVRATDELCRAGTLSDVTLLRMLDQFEAALAHGLAAIIAWFSLLSLILNGCRLPVAPLPGH